MSLPANLQGPNFTLISELQTLTRRDWTLATPAELMPLGPNPLLDGEWVGVNSNYQVDRDAAGVGGTVESSNPLEFVVFTERGRYDTQAIGKVNTLMFGMYEAQSLIVNLAGVTVGSPLTVQNVTYNGLTKRGLALKVAGDGSGVVVVGYCSRLPGNNAVRFVHMTNQVLF
jgi:hypothetical protein